MLDTNVLDDDMDADWCTVEWFYDLGAMVEHLPGSYREAAFLRHPAARSTFGQVAGAVAGSDDSMDGMDGLGSIGGVDGMDGMDGVGDGDADEPHITTSAGDESASGAPAPPPPPTFYIEASAAWRLVPPPEGATILTPADVTIGATDDEIRKWLAPYADAPILELGDMTGRVHMPGADNQDDLSGGERGGGERGGGGIASAGDGLGGGDGAHDAEAVALTARLMRGVAYREDIERYVRQQVSAAAPFECLCVPPSLGAGGGAGAAKDVDLASLIPAFAKRVARSTAVFVAGYRVDLDSDALEAFQQVWPNVYALALYDWNGAGLQGLQFSSAINRLVCTHARRVHWPDGSTKESCW
jgi:hypothetical protein